VAPPRANIMRPVDIVADSWAPRVPLPDRSEQSVASDVDSKEPDRARRAAYGQQSTPESALNSSVGRELGSLDVPPTGARGSKSAWDLTAVGQGLPREETVLIIDDCTLHRENLAAVFALNGIAAPRVAWDLSSLVLALEGVEPDVVLLNMATRGSHLLLRATMDICPNVRVIVLGASVDDEAEIVACAEAGVAGYLKRTDSLEDLIALINHATAGESSCPPPVAATLLSRLATLISQRQPPVRELVLTAREAQILSMLELGRSNQDIAAQLCIAVHTVKNHVHSLLTKLGVSTRAEAAALSRTTRIGIGTKARTRSRSNQN
jgi:DNA-binding NarL/FixJ family response regulator